MPFRTLELCAGAGGLALGLHRAGWRPDILIDVDGEACRTLSHNWDCHVIRADIRDGLPLDGVRPDMVCGGPPCQPFSTASKRLGPRDVRDCFLAAVRIATRVEAPLFLFENVVGITHAQHRPYVRLIEAAALDAGYGVRWLHVDARECGIPQRRPRVFFVGVRGRTLFPEFGRARYRRMRGGPPMGACIADLVGGNGWEGAGRWVAGADGPAPCICGGSSGTIETGTKSRAEWLGLGVDSSGVADDSPAPGHDGPIRLTIPMLARLMSFPDWYGFIGSKWKNHTLICNAVPPEMGRVLGAYMTRLAGRAVGKPPAVHARPDFRRQGGQIRGGDPPPDGAET